MKSYELFKKYIWLINTIHRAGRISLQEINSKWIRSDMSGGENMSRTTFNRHKSAIEEMFGILIGCNRKNGYTYYIENNSVLYGDSLQNWMLSTISVNNLISESMGLQNRILLENIPSENENLSKVIHAMKDGVMINVDYRRYNSDKAKSFCVSPYCVKLFRQRWYVLAEFEGKGLAILSFDRIEKIELTDMAFETDKDFSARDYFSRSFGIMVDDKLQAERIVIRVFGNERFYLKDLPLHSSQKVVEEGEDYTDIQLYIQPTSDFKSHILSRGQWLKVLYPEQLAREICDLHTRAAEIYKRNISVLR